MQLEVVAVGVLCEQLRGRLCHPRADRHQVERHDVQLAGLAGAEEVGQAQPPIAALPREGEPRGLLLVIVSGEDHEVVALGNRGPIAVDDGSFQDAVGVQAIQPQP